jgi:uncharacterized membrane protein (UPF0127 family)
VRIVVLGFLIVMLVGLPPAGLAQDACVLDAGATPYAVVQIDTYPRLDLELARTSEERELGLMYRAYLPPDSGMLFIYQAPATEAYWMYHTELPLSIAWIDRDGTILTIKDMPRLDNPDDQQEASRTVYSPDATYWYALEVNEGWFVQHGVGVGQQISFCLPSSA